MKEPEYYDPSIEYFMISVFDTKDIRHIRIPFRTRKEVNEWYKALPKTGNLYRNFEVFNEKTLDLVAKYEINDAGDEIPMTLRQAIFGPNYQHCAESFMAGEMARMFTD